MAEINYGLMVPGNSPLRLFSVDERTNLAVEAYDSLGLVGGDKPKAFDQIGQSMQFLYDRLKTIVPAAEVEPFFSMELSEEFCFCALLHQFDRMQPHKSQVSKFWKKYSVDELNRRTLNGPVPTAPNTAMTGEARGMLLGSDHAFEKGLHQTGESLRRQKETSSGSVLMNPADYIIVDAQRRVAGLPPLDTNTISRFMQLDKSREWGAVVNAGMQFNGANVGAERLNLHGVLNGGYKNVGMRILAEHQV